MSVYFASDLHLGHRAITKYRPQFETVEQHDKYILDLLTKKLYKKDKIYLLGDNAFSVKSFNQLIEAIPKGCIVEYILGNHDLQFDLTTKYIAEHVNKVEGIKKYKDYWISHAPIHPIELRKRINIHGHAHHDLFGEGYINVCMDFTDMDIVRLEKLPELYEKQLKIYEDKKNEE